LTFFTANIAAPVSPKCGNSFWSRLTAVKFQRRIAIPRILPALVIGVAVWATLSQTALIHQMKLPSFLALNASHRAIGFPHVGCSIQRYPDGKTACPPASKDLNTGNGLTAGPMPDGLKALFPESHVVYADCLGFHHAGRIRAERRGLCARCALEQVERESRSQPAGSKKPRLRWGQSKRGSLGVRLVA
jgi:hypothetical protein